MTESGGLHCEKLSDCKVGSAMRLVVL